MPGKTFGNSVGSGSASSLTILYDSVGNDASNGWINGPRVDWYQKSGWSDSNNAVYVGGGAVLDAKVHEGTLNSSRTWWCTNKAVPLRYGAKTWTKFDVQVVNVSFFNGDASTNTYTLDVELPEKPYKTPRPAKAFTATRASDSRVDTAWTADYDGGDGAQPWSNQYIERTSTGSWNDTINVSGELSWSPTSWADTTVQPNKRYDYRHVARNPAGYSAWVYSTPPVYTTPAAPTNLVAVKLASGDIQLDFTNAAPWANGFEVSDSPDGTTWTVLSAAVTGNRYIVTAPSTAVTHRFRVRAKTPNGLWSAYSTTSNTIQLLAAPNAPEWLPSEPAYDVTVPVLFKFRHNPVDSTPQTRFQIQRRRQGGTWLQVAEVVSPVSEWTMPTGFYSNGGLPVELQVRTKGAHADWSPWSSTLSFQPSARPVVGMSLPANGTTYPTARSAGFVKWTYQDSDGTAQSAWRVMLRDAAGVLLDQWNGSGPQLTFTFPYELATDTSYIVGVQVRDGSRLWSEEAQRTFTIVYLPPPVPLVVTTWDLERGGLALQISNPTGTVNAVSNDVYRDGVLIASDLPINTTFTDPLPLTTRAGSTYRVEAVSALPSRSVAVVTVPPDEEVRRRFWLNAGNGWVLVASFRGGVNRSRTVGIASDVEHYAGRDLPVATLGQAAQDDFKLTATVVQAEDSPADFHAIARARTLVCFRDMTGRYYARVSPITESSTQDITAAISFDLVRVDYEEGKL